MPSFTFNSKNIGHTVQATPNAISAKTGIVLLLTGLALIYMALEVLSPKILARFSRIENRINHELAQAKQLNALNDGHPTVLVVGNSLLHEGVQLDPLRADLAPDYDVNRLVIEQTHYLDWYFGLRRLLAEGSHPSVIVLTLDPSQLASGFTLGESFARRQMSIRDFPQVVRDASLDRTTASTYFLAHWSNWLGDKGYIRQCVMILMVPHFRELAARMADHGSHINDRARLLAMAQERLPEFGKLGEENGIRMILLIPPALHQNYSLDIQELGTKLNVPVWVPSPPGEFPSDLYRDGFHLNAQGSKIFTERLANEMRKLPPPPSAGTYR